MSNDQRTEFRCAGLLCTGIGLSAVGIGFSAGFGVFIFSKDIIVSAAFATVVIAAAARPVVQVMGWIYNEPTP